MKTQEDIDREVGATLEIGRSLSPVAPPDGLQQRILQRIPGQRPPAAVPFYRRTGFAAAAAAVIIAVNVATVIHLARGQRQAASTVTQEDRYAELRTTYFPENDPY